MNGSAKQKQSASSQRSNPIETDSERSAKKKSAPQTSSYPDNGVPLYEQLLGGQNEYVQMQERTHVRIERSAAAAYVPRKEFGTIFSIQAESDQRTIRELMNRLKSEMQMVKRDHSALKDEINDIDKLLITSYESDGRIYDIRFLEVIISILKVIRAKISESRTWLMSFRGKAAKKGYAYLSKKKGSQYSMSQEMSAARAG